VKREQLLARNGRRSSMDPTQVEAIIAAILATGMSRSGASEATMVENYRLVLAEMCRTGGIEGEKSPAVSRDR
jgi:hypothetical protein